MSLNAHKALQQFYTDTRNQLTDSDIVHRRATIPADWEYAKDKVVPIETTLQLFHPTANLVTLMFSGKYVLADRRPNPYPTHVVECITIQHTKAIEIWAKYAKDEAWVSSLLSQIGQVAVEEFPSNTERQIQQKAVRDAYLKAYHVALPAPVVLLLDDLDNNEEDGPSLNLAWKFIHNFTNVVDLQVTFSVKKNTLKLDVLGQEVTTYRLRSDVEKLQNFTFYEPK